MIQLQFDVPDSIAEKIQHKAGQAQLSVSKYLAQLVKREVLVDRWPQGYGELFDQWEGEPLKRYSEGDYEQRLEIE